MTTWSLWILLCLICLYINYYWIINAAFKESVEQSNVEARLNALLNTLGHLFQSFYLLIALTATCTHSSLPRLRPCNIMCFFVNGEVAFLRPTSFSFHASTCTCIVYTCLEIIVDRLNMFAFAIPTSMCLLMGMLCFYKLND
jgi:hypothetical protein